MHKGLFFEHCRGVDKAELICYLLVVLTQQTVKTKSLGLPPVWELSPRAAKFWRRPNFVRLTRINSDATCYDAGWTSQDDGLPPTWELSSRSAGFSQAPNIVRQSEADKRKGPPCGGPWGKKEGRLAPPLPELNPLAGHALGSSGATASKTPSCASNPHTDRRGGFRSSAFPTPFFPNL